MAQQKNQGNVVVLLIGSTGSGKSALGNYLLNEGQEETFYVGRSNLPETQSVKKATSGPLTIIDTPGLNERSVKDLEHMIQIVGTLDAIDSLSAAVMVVKFHSTIDAQYKATVKYYSRLLKKIFDSNAVIVLTGYSSDPTSVERRKKQGVDVERDIRNTTKEIRDCAGLLYDPPVFLIDSLPVDTDMETSKLSKEARKAILGYTAQLKPVSPQNMKFEKTYAIKQMDQERQSKLDGLITGYIRRITDIEENQREVLKKIQAIQSNVSVNSQEICMLKEKIDLLDTEEEITIDKWSIEKRGSWWFQTATFELKSPEADISNCKKWDNGHLSWEITQKKRTVEGKVRGKFLRGLYGVITIYATKRSIMLKK